MKERHEESLLLKDDMAKYGGNDIEMKESTKIESAMIRVDHICCHLEVQIVYDLLQPMDGIVEVSVSQSDRTAYVKHRASLPAMAIVDAINSKHLGASLKQSGEVGKEDSAWTRVRPLVQFDVECDEMSIQ